jgi:hypothetical protein
MTAAALSLPRLRRCCLIEPILFPEDFRIVAVEELIHPGEQCTKNMVSRSVPDDARQNSFPPRCSLFLKVGAALGILTAGLKLRFTPGTLHKCAQPLQRTNH